MGTRSIRVVGWLAPGLVAASLALAAPKRQEPADEDEAHILGRRAFVENCLMCHAEGMTSRQRLTAKQWTAELDKMIGWGAPVPADRKAILLAYLTREFSEKAPPPPLDLASPDEVLGEDSALAIHPTGRGDVARGGVLFTQHCATCHGPIGHGGDLGTRLAGRPVLLDDARYREAVRQGLRRMPGFANVLKPDAEDDLLAWLRTREDDAPGR